ncbi:ABC transporter permease [Nocardiopsis sp. NPDC006832]|uniref:ABC transporter permease n=1 Tax=Nocardiopsis sp. NPDC006832 TaxID=3157188 RepID=UPI0033C9A479
MSHPPKATAAEPGAPVPPPPARLPEAFQSTPDSERYVLQADALRRRQLRAAILYGSSRYWRTRQRVWPSVIVGLILAALVAAALVVFGAFQTQRDLNEERRQDQTQNPLTPLTPQERDAQGTDQNP